MSKEDTTTIDSTTVYALFEELKADVAIIKDNMANQTASTSDYSVTPVVSVDTEKIENAIDSAFAKHFSHLEIQVESPKPDLSSLPKPIDHSEAIGKLTESVDVIKKDISGRLQRLEAAEKELSQSIAADKETRHVRHHHTVDKKSWPLIWVSVSTAVCLIFCVVNFFWQEARIEKAMASEVKYHFILMKGGINTAGLDSLERWMGDQATAARLEAQVRDYEYRVQETARAIQQREQLNDKIETLKTPSKK